MGLDGDNLLLKSFGKLYKSRVFFSRGVELLLEVRYDLSRGWSGLLLRIVVVGGHCIGRGDGFVF